ncbi:hypothetical protein ABZ464_47165 [Streptomyces sp. NPDC005820]|uniref:hypothetical protein n=1 Tax=Streptomyces sp. NPDC005820 TaxID=3157069 RepID=UPI0033E9E8D2
MTVFSGAPGTTANANCDPGDIVTGGGFIAGNGSQLSSRPVIGVGVQGWQATQNGAGNGITAFAVCADVTP